MALESREATKISKEGLPQGAETKFGRGEPRTPRTST